MKARRWLVGFAAVAIAATGIAILLHDTSAPARDSAALGTGPARRTLSKLAPTSSIAGTVRDATGTPIAGAAVCAQTKDREVTCAAANTRGEYSIDHLFPVAYEVTAAAPRWVPGRAHPDGNSERDRFLLEPGEQRTHVDIVLEAGAVELAGTVSDISGSPIAHARVRIAREGQHHDDWRHWDPGTETGADGTFTLWLAPGGAVIEASADGYARIEQNINAPGETALLLTPAGSIAGTVVDRDGKPVADALVAADSSIDVHERTHSDDLGRFEIEGLVPARYDVAARTANSYGTAVGSVLVGYAAHVDGIIIRVDPAAHIVGRVMTKPPGTLCPPADVDVTLHDPRGDDIEMTPALDGTLHADGVIAGTYYPRVSCRGYYPLDRYSPVVVTDRDQQLVWTVVAGASIRGHVRNVDGTPVASAWVDVFGRKIATHSRSDGSFELAGVPAGNYLISAAVNGARVTTERLAVGTRDIETELTLDRSAEISGIVVDEANRPVGSIEVSAEATRYASERDTTRDDGAFTLYVKPATYNVQAWLDWQHAVGKPEQATATLARPAMVRLVIPAQDGTISGDVMDAAGRPVSDALVHTTGPSELDESPFVSGLLDHPTRTAPDGSFVIRGLGPGRYTVVAERRGGGMTRAKGIERGAKIHLQLSRMGSLAGTVSYIDHTHPAQMKLTIRGEVEHAGEGAGEDEERFFREQRFYHTDGAFTLDGLPAGTFTLAVETPDGLGVASVLLGEGERRDGVAITVDRSVELRGRLVDVFSHKGQAGFLVVPSTQRAELATVEHETDVANETDAKGNFSVLAPQGPATLLLAHEVGRHAWCAAPVHFDLHGPKDIGEVSLVYSRAVMGGAVGFSLDKGVVDSVVPDSPAAAAGLRLGDVVTAIDGITSSSLIESCGFAMIEVPAGTVLSLTLARGETIKLTAGPAPPGAESEITGSP